MEVTKHEQAIIHEVMLMSYEQGIEEGRKQSKETIEDLSLDVQRLYEQKERLKKINEEQTAELEKIKTRLRDIVDRAKRR